MFLLSAFVLVSTGCDVVDIKRDYHHYDGSNNSYGNGNDSDDNSVVRLSDDPYAISSDFSVALPYQEAYRRADAYARACRTSKTFARRSWSVRSNLFDDDKNGFVHISTYPLGPDLERIDISANGASAAFIKVTARNSSTWDQLELDSARQSIETGIPACRDKAR